MCPFTCALEFLPGHGAHRASGHRTFKWKQIKYMCRKTRPTLLLTRSGQVDSEDGTESAAVKPASAEERAVFSLTTLHLLE